MNIFVIQSVFSSFHAITKNNCISFLNLNIVLRMDIWISQPANVTSLSEKRIPPQIELLKINLKPCTTKLQQYRNFTRIAPLVTRLLMLILYRFSSRMYIAYFAGAFLICVASNSLKNIPAEMAVLFLYVISKMGFIFISIVFILNAYQGMSVASERIACA